MPVCHLNLIINMIDSTTKYTVLNLKRYFLFFFKTILYFIRFDSPITNDIGNTGWIKLYRVWNIFDISITQCHHTQQSRQNWTERRKDMCIVLVGALLFNIYYLSCAAATLQVCALALLSTDYQDTKCVIYYSLVDRRCKLSYCNILYF